MATIANSSEPLYGANKRILIFGVNYWPEETGNAPYTTGLAQYLVERGNRVTVVAGMPHYPQWQVYDGYRDCFRMAEQVRGVDILRVSHYVPRKQTALHRARYEASYLLQALTVDGLRKPDVVLGVMPSLSGGYAAWAAAKRFRVPFGLIIQDLIGQAAKQSGIRGGRAVADLTRRLESMVLCRASQVAIIAERFQGYLEDLGIDEKRIVHIPNWSHIAKPQSRRSDVRRVMGWADDEAVVLHAGNMGLKQGLENVIHTARLARTQNPSLRFVLMGDGNQRTYLEELAAGLSNVQFLAPQPAEQFPDILAAADVLLVNERPSVADMSLPSKLTSYFVAGRPIVAATGLHGTTAAEINKVGAGIVVPAGEPENLLETLIRVIGDAQLGIRLAAAGTEFADRYLTPSAVLCRYENWIWRLVER